MPGPAESSVVAESSPSEVVAHCEQVIEPLLWLLLLWGRGLAEGTHVQALQRKLHQVVDLLRPHRA